VLADPRYDVERTINSASLVHVLDYLPDFVWFPMRAVVLGLKERNDYVALWWEYERGDTTQVKLEFRGFAALRTVPAGWTFIGMVEHRGSECFIYYRRAL
jgi:hypothetical protein